MSLYSSSVKRPVTTILIFVALIVLGLFSLRSLPIDLFPDVETNTIMVMTSYAGTSASDIEQIVTRPLENSLNSVADLKDVTSSSRENVSLLTLEFQYGTDIEVATNDVRDKLDMIKSSLPDGASNPTIFKFSADDMPIMILACTASQSVSALDKILDDRVATPLARVSGVGTVSVSGAPNREIKVYCDPTKLEAYGISITSLSSVIAAENRNVPSGSIDIGSNTYSASRRSFRIRRSCWTLWWAIPAVRLCTCGTWPAWRTAWRRSHRNPTPTAPAARRSSSRSSRAIIR